MKNLIKFLIFLFFALLMLANIFIPAMGLGFDTELEWYIEWMVASNTIIGMAVFIIPVIFIFKWIDENIK